MLDIVDLKRSTYYSVLKPVHISPQVTAINERILELYLESKGILGYRQMAYLLHQEGIKINRETVRKRMRTLGLKTKLRAKNANRLARKKWGEETNAPNLLERNFKMDHPDQAYVTDVTEWRLASKIRVYLSIILDLHNREVIDWQLSTSNNLELVKSNLRAVVQKRGDCSNVIFHSDQGQLYHNPSFQALLKENGMIQSMSRKANCLDNAVAESSFAIIKTETSYMKQFCSVEAVKSELSTYFIWYNNDRPKRYLGGLSPEQFKKVWRQNQICASP